MSPKEISENEKEKLVKNMVDQFVVNDETLRQIAKSLTEEIELGLSSSAEKSSLKMLPSYVTALPNGEETGSFLAMDLGGTHLRVLLVKFEGQRSQKTDIKFKIYKVQKDVMTGSGEKLFDQIASCLAEFLTENRLVDQKLPLGFTFSFPLEQNGLKSGRLLHWTKGFSCSGVVGEDVVRLLQDAVQRRKDININVVAILNDSVGTLMSLCYEDTSCLVAVVVGTGTNACYVEKMSRCPKLANLKKSESDMVINMEWGAFGDHGQLDTILNKYDKIVDSNSINPGKQTFEKLISGMYMGEHVRLVLLDLAEQGVIFAGQSTTQLAEKYSLSSKVISEVENDAGEKNPTFEKTMQFFSKFNISNVNKKDWEIVHKICQAVSVRSAYLCAAGIVGILHRMRQKSQVTVGMDGAVYRFHPHYKSRLESKLNELIDKDIQFKIKSSEDGSGRGAAVVAAVAVKIKEGAC